MYLHLHLRILKSSYNQYLLHPPIVEFIVGALDQVTQNHGFAESGRPDLGDMPLIHPAQGRTNQIRFVRFVSSWVLNMPKDGVFFP